MTTTTITGPLGPVAELRTFDDAGVGILRLPPRWNPVEYRRVRQVLTGQGWRILPIDSQSWDVDDADWSVLAVERVE